MKDDKRFMKLKNHKTLPRPPFRITMIGSTMSGKTTQALQLIKSYANGKYFDAIYWISPTHETDDKKIMQLRAHDNEPPVVIDHWDSGEIKDLLDIIKKENQERKKEKMPKLRILFVLDDLADNKRVLNAHSSTLVDRIYLRGRHEGISCIVLSQLYSAMSRGIRETNLSHLYLLNVGSRTLQKVAEEHAPSWVEPTDFKHFLQKMLNENPYTPVIIDYTRPSKDRVHMNGETYNKDKKNI